MAGTTLLTQFCDIGDLPVGIAVKTSESAHRAVLSHASIKTHVSRIFAKLEARDRTQAAIAAY